MTGGIAVLTRSRWIAVAGIGLLLALVAYAWIDGGERAVRPIAEPVALPEAGQ